MFRGTIQLAAMLSLIGAAAATAADDTPRQQHALLVGCTEYPYVERLPTLYGPAHDVGLWHKLLTSPSPTGFAVPGANVTRLAGWPDDARLRPSRENIVREFERLIKLSAPGVQFFILMSGHGTQQPIGEDQDPLDPANPEPDGLDEVFLPADSKEGSPAIENGIVDNVLGQWLDQMRAQGADVWIVFDCCHSGTMTRGGPDGDLDKERTRFVEPTALGIQQKKLDDAARRAQSAVQAARAAGRSVDAEQLASAAPAKRGGSLVAFFAAQPFERAPELPLPETAPHTPDNYFGLLSYTLVQTLLERHSPMSYRELTRVLAANYRARRGTRFPTPFAEGDLDREVLGARQWPIRSELFLAKTADGYEIGAGELHGLSKDSVLAVHPPINDPRDPKSILGYVRVAEVTPTSAIVTPQKFADKSAVEDLPALGRCEIVSRDLGEMRVKLFADQSPPLQAALAQIDPQVKQMLLLVSKEADAEWLLRSAGNRVFLVPGQGRSQSAAAESDQQQADERLRSAGQPLPRKTYGEYQLDEKTLTGAIERDLPKIFKWQNLWRVAHGVNVVDGAETHGLVFEALKVNRQTDQQGESFRGGSVPAGQLMKFTLKNEGIENLWVTMLYLDANLGIKDYSPGQIQRGAALRPYVFRLTDEGNSIGQEGIIVFAIPASVQKDRPDFSFLEQEPLQVTDAVKRSTTQAPSTPFGRLLAAAAFNQGTRGAEPLVSTTPAIMSHSWVLVSKPQR